MPRYYFNIRDNEMVRDASGLDLAGSEDARREATHLVEKIRGFFQNRTFWIVVTDESGETVCEVEGKG